ncbi:DUF2764 domain-containing protein [Odoribacter sp. OttesenSCG-928-A06]|nr:DUF2764 domain-containing protein [Odoribacter sp. OttesenSCG-928-A06]
MKKDYTAFIAGLPEIAWSDRKRPLTVLDFREQARNYIGGKDEELLNMLFLSNDNRQVLRLLNKREPIADLETVYPLSLLEDEVREPEGLLPYYLNRFIAGFKDGHHEYTQKPANILSAMYYDYMIDSGNAFLSGYAAFARDLKNVLTALVCKKHARELVPEIVGDNEFSHALKNSHAKDFGLAIEYPWVDQVITLMENKNLVERERGIDLLRWNYIEEAVTFKYFSIERVLAFAMELRIIERWSKMDSESGRRIFREMIEKFKKNLVFEKQFEQ